MLASQRTGQSELHHGDNFRTAHQAAGQPTPAGHCARDRLAAALHRPAETHLWGNEMTVRWMKNASADIFQQISSQRLFHPLASRTLTNKHTKTIHLSQLSVRLPEASCSHALSPHAFRSFYQEVKAGAAQRGTVDPSPLW